MGHRLLVDHLDEHISWFSVMSVRSDQSHVDLNSSRENLSRKSVVTERYYSYAVDMNKTLDFTDILHCFYSIALNLVDYFCF